MCAFDASIQSAFALTQDARGLYHRFQCGGSRAALIAAMRKVNSAMCELRLAGYSLKHSGGVNSACARVCYYTLRARECELYELYDLVSVQLTPTERLKTAH